MRGSVRGRGNHSRGGRGGRGGGHRGGASNAPHPNAGGGGGVNSGTLYEDVYEPARPPPVSANNSTTSFLNGSTTGASATSYFEEFPEPRVSAAGGSEAPALAGFQRQTPNSKSLKLQQKNHHMPPHAASPTTAAPGVSGAPTHVQQQRAY